ncbi:MAG: hypothetical protein H6746_17235 [Deltaproteobacteria bacterium]|nr:hypothetical protein [Deltaproteobacteria bacterium]
MLEQTHLPGSADAHTGAVRADSHLLELPRHGATQSLTDRELTLLYALMVRGRTGTLPDGAGRIDPAPLVELATAAGIVIPLADNARRLGMVALAEGCALERQRQRFIGRERWNTAREAASRIALETGRLPVALGALAATCHVHEDPADRLRHRITLLVPHADSAEARRLVSDLAGVEIVSRALPGIGRRSSEAAIWLRASPPRAGGWRLPAIEDLFLLECLDFSRSQSAERLGILSDLLMMTWRPRLHWETVLHRADAWRTRAATYDAIDALRHSVGARIPLTYVSRLRPTWWDRFSAAIG